MILTPAIVLGMIVWAVPSQEEKPRLVLTPPEVQDAVLLDAEAAQLHEAVAAFLTQQNVGAELVSPAEIRALAVLAASGRTTDEGPVCAKSPGLHELISRRYPGAGRAHVTATSTCKPSPGDSKDQMTRLERDKSCERIHVLEVGARIPGVEGQEDRWLRWRATVANPATGQGWIAAVRSLRESPGPSNGYSLLGLDKEKGVELEYSVLLGPWGKRSPFFSRAPSGSAAVVPLRPAFAAVDERLQTCHVVGYGHFSVGIQLDPGGKVAACIPRTDNPAGQAHRRCLCDAFEQVTFPKGAKDRRLFVELVNHHPARGTPNGPLFPPRTENDVWVSELPSESAQEVRDAANACVKGKPLSAKFEAALTLALAPDGTVSEAEFQLPPGLEGTRGCLVEALRKARFVCPVEGTSPVKAKLRLEPPARK